MAGGIPESMAKLKFLMDLIQKGQYETEVDVLGNKIKMRALDAGEWMDVLRETNGLDAFAKSTALQHAVLCRSILSVNGSWVPNMEEIRIFVGKLPPLAVDAFWQKYEEIRTYRDMAFGKVMSDLKNSSRNQNPASIGDSVSSPDPSGSDPSTPSNHL